MMIDAQMLALILALLSSHNLNNIYIINDNIPLPLPIYNLLVISTRMIGKVIASYMLIISSEDYHS